MEKNKTVVLTAVTILAIAFIAVNFENITGNYLDRDPKLTMLTPEIKAGTYLVFNAKNTALTQEYRIHYPNERFTGVRFGSTRGDCERTIAGNYDCTIRYRVPTSALANGGYYIQAKSDRSGNLIGNKAHFMLTDSKYLESGR
ncbi:MAG: hypothetical protein CMH63_02655 [Nanoarchaeota archaeon]|nr:hypothetical protein [Nanoarchaeota archaeon]|tara:strand:+ start:11854 stop:12282 length:429 start_codon:yes stop_codon:yes gene_type:complete